MCPGGVSLCKVNKITVDFIHEKYHLIVVEFELRLQWGISDAKLLKIQVPLVVVKI